MLSAQELKALKTLLSKPVEVVEFSGVARRIERQAEGKHLYRFAYVSLKFDGVSFIFEDGDEKATKLLENLALEEDFPEGSEEPKQDAPSEQTVKEESE